MRCWIELSASALRHNYRLFAKLSNQSQLIPIIKSNAYGHGLDEVYRVLASETPPWLGVNYLESADQLRGYGYRGKILVVGPVRFSDFEYASRINADIFLGDDPSLEAFLALAPDKRPRVHLKFDTGMSRQGFASERAEEIANKLGLHQERVIGICSHFANVEDVINHQYADEQLAKFNQVRQVFQNQGFKLLGHIASSASTLLMKDATLDMTRVGISLYGMWPSQTTRVSFLQVFNRLEELKPVLTWKTEVALTKTISEGQFIGYGCTYRAVKEMNIAILPVGYYEGYPRIASGRGSYVLIQGKRCPIVGRICMNMMMVDVSHLGKVPPGVEVTLIGKDANEEISAETLGDWSETIHYEVLTCLNSKIPRRIVE